MPANLGGLVYGTIAVAALLAAESARRETYPRTVGAVAVTLILYWVAHSYAEFAEERVQHEEHLSFRGLWVSALYELPVLFGAAVPFAVLLLCWALGVGLEAGVAAAVWTSAAMIVLIEIGIGVRAQLKGRELLAQTLVGGLLGLLVVALRVLLH